jgi:uncharacterized protein YcbK (DUF882 family)
MYHRRQFLAATLGLIAGAGLTEARAAVPQRSLAFDNLHTGEKLSAIYWADGRHVPDACQKIDRVLRDHRSGEVAAISPPLLDLLYILRTKLDKDAPFEVISGYRSPKTNASMVKPGGGVASDSLHTRGMAIDIRMPGCGLARLRDEATALKLGGVGYYPKSDFVHVDIGRVRYW